MTLSEQPSHVQSAHPRRKLGVLAGDSRRPRLHLSRYTAPELVAAVPNGIDYLSHLSHWPMYANDQIGDCTAAAAAHIEGVWASYGQGRSVVVPEASVIEFYSTCSGYAPGIAATDQGARLQDCLAKWRQAPGLGGHRIAAFFAVDPTDAAMVRTALYLFGALYVGVMLPKIAQDQLDEGQPWDVVDDDGGDDGGHCVHLGAASVTGNYKVTTWGRVQEVTPAWWRRYVMEAWVPVSATWVEAGLSPAGLDAATLNRDFTALTGEPGPFPPSIVPPAPAPIGGRGRHAGPPTPPGLTVPADEVGDVDVDLATALRRWLGHRQWSSTSRTLAVTAVDWLTARNL